MNDLRHRKFEEEIFAELKRLRHEDEILHQERDIFEYTTAFFAKDGSRRVSVFRPAEDKIPTSHPYHPPR